jgi:Nitrile hydratase, alpha chain
MEQAKQEVSVGSQADCGVRGARLRFYDDTGLMVLENTSTVPNLIVCTLYSCYPRPVLGLAPDW